MSSGGTPPGAPSLAEQMRNFSSSRRALTIGFVWGLSEGTFFFIVPDVFTTLVAIFRLRAGLKIMAASIAGSLVGAIIMYSLVGSFGEASMVRFVDAIPELSTEMIEDVSTQMTESVPKALLRAQWQGSPYKIYSVAAASQGTPLWQYLLWSVPARLPRLLGFTLYAGILGFIFRKGIRKYVWIALTIWAITWAMMYAYYWTIN